MINTYDMSNDFDHITLKTIKAVSDAQPTSMTDSVGNYFAVGVYEPSTYGELILFSVDTLNVVASASGSSLNHHLGEYIWLAYDAPVTHLGRVVVASTHYASSTSRYIDLYRPVGSTLELWQSSIV